MYIFQENYFTLEFYLGSSIRCAAHTMQLCVLDSLKDTTSIERMETYHDIIKKARNVVKTLRNQNFMSLIQEEKLPKPILDCASR